MSRSQTKYTIWKEASLSQKLSASKDGEIYQKLAGSDPETSETIGTLLIFGQHGLIDLEDPNVSLLLDLLDVRRKALFATSPHTNEITKMGLQMPKSEDLVSEFGDED